MHEEQGQEHAQPNYMAIFYWLLALTIVEVVVAYMHLDRLDKIFFLGGLAVVKAGLVALFFMHLKYERILIYLIVIFPLALAGFLSLVVTQEILLPR